MSVEEMIKIYKDLRVASGYIFGYTLNGSTYMVVVDDEAPEWIFKRDRSSRGAGKSLRFRPTIAEKNALLDYGECYEITIPMDGKYNKGEKFEKAVHEHFQQVWEKDRVPFYKGCDIEIDGKKYEIKFQNATFTNEKS